MRVYKEIEFYADGGCNKVEVAFYIDADDIVASIEENPKGGEQAVLRSMLEKVRGNSAV